MARIVVLGAGLGGMSAAYSIRSALAKEHTVTVIGDGPWFNFTPSNPWLAVGWRKPEQIRLDVAAPLAVRGIAFTPVAARRVEPEAHRVVLCDDKIVDYDRLVVTTGPRLAFERVPGMGPQAHTESVCTGPHAEHAWSAYERFLQRPGPVVVGAVQGASCFGPAYEFAMILDADLRRRKVRDRVPIAFVTSEPYIGHMGLGGVGDSRGLLESELRHRHIRWITNARVIDVEPDLLHAEELDHFGKLAEAHDVRFSYAMLIPGFAGVEAVHEIEGLVNPAGFVLIDEHQRNPTFPAIYAAGVCVAIPPIETTPVPTGVPKTGLMIESMVSAVAANLRDDLAGRPLQAQATWNALCLADMGDNGFAFVALPQIPPRNVTKTMSGKWVHVAKVGFEKYFLQKMRRGTDEPWYEKRLLAAFGVTRLKSTSSTE